METYGKLEQAQRDSKHQIRALQRQHAYLPQAKMTVAKKAQKENNVHQFRHKGVYTPEARALARILTKAGCSAEYVGNVIQSVCGSVGVKAVGKMSRRTVSRAVMEGGVAATMQLGYELTTTEGKFI